MSWYSRALFPHKSPSEYFSSLSPPPTLTSHFKTFFSLLLTSPFSHITSSSSSSFSLIHTFLFPHHTFPSPWPLFPFLTPSPPQICHHHLPSEDRWQTWLQGVECSVDQLCRLQAGGWQCGGRPSQCGVYWGDFMNVFCVHSWCW